MPFPNANATLDKPAARLWLAGTESRNPILSGLASTASIRLRSGEALRSVTITATSFSKTLTFATSGTTATTQTIEYGTDTASSTSGTKNLITWVTNRGTRSRQFWVKDLPSSGALYVNNTAVDSTETSVYVNIGGAKAYEDKATFSINILPTFDDEFFLQGEASTNRYANTIRSWGGAQTAEVFMDGSQIIAETDIANIHGYLWDPATYGLHTIVVRLRATTASSYYVDITGSIRARQFSS